MKKLRTGIGFDAHRFSADKKQLFLGCVEIPFEKGLEGHSDADVLAHTICDCLLGAAAMGDIGGHFPDSDPEYKNVSGTFLLEQTRIKLSKAGFEIINVDSVVICEKPVISPHIGEMKNKISRSLGIEKKAVNVKATTTEGMGFTGRGEGIAAKAACLIEEKF